jgi:hypothetical protein
MSQATKEAISSAFALACGLLAGGARGKSLLGRYDSWRLPNCELPWKIIGFKFGGKRGYASIWVQGEVFVGPVLRGGHKDVCYTHREGIGDAFMVDGCFDTGGAAG